MSERKVLEFDTPHPALLAMSCAWHCLQQCQQGAEPKLAEVCEEIGNQLQEAIRQLEYFDRT